MRAGEADTRMPGFSSAKKRPAIAFLGCGFDFSDRMLQLLSDELEGVEITRLDTLDQVAHVAESPNWELRLVVIAQSRCHDLVSRSERYSDAAAEGHLVFAYDDVEAARVVRDGLVVLNEAPRVHFLPMRCSIDGWIAHVRLLLLREWVVPAELAEPIAEATDRAGGADGTSDGVSDQPVPRLTAREHEILTKVSEGHRNKSIARELGLSEHTVKLHLHNIFGKIGVDNRSRATAWFLANAERLPGRERDRS